MLHVNCGSISQRDVIHTEIIFIAQNWGKNEMLADVQFFLSHKFGVIEHSNIFSTLRDFLEVLYPLSFPR